MKTLLMIGGPMGVGKTTAARMLLNRLEDAVWLDGDWCWMQGRNWHFDAESREMVMDHICHLLNGFLSNRHFQTVIFSWVLHLPEVHAQIRAALQAHEFRLVNVSLVCDREALARRIHGRARQSGMSTEEERAQLERALDRMRCYEALDTIHLDVSAMSAEQVCGALEALLQGEHSRAIP